MTDAENNVQETSDSATEVLVDNSSGKGANPFRSGAPKPIELRVDVDDDDDDEAEQPVAKKPAEKKPADKNASLDEIEDVALLRKLVKETRREAAKARTEKQAELKEFDSWRNAQKTEQERAIEQASARAAAAEKRADELVAKNLQLEFNISDELAEFITGDSEEEMRARAEKLRDTKLQPTREEAPASELEEPVKRGPGLLAGKRGTPISKPQTTNDWFTDFMNGN